MLFQADKIARLKRIFVFEVLSEYISRVNIERSVIVIKNVGLTWSFFS